MVRLLLIVTLLAFVLAPIPVLADSPHDWTIEGDRVFVDDANVYLAATPHTLDSSGWVEFELRSKVYEGDIDVALGFSYFSGASPRSPQIWQTFAPHTEYDIVPYNALLQSTIYDITSYNVLVKGSVPPDIGNDANPKLVEVVSANGTATVVAFQSYTQDGNSATFSHWSTLQHKQPRIVQYPDWTPLTKPFKSVNYSYKGSDQWHFTTMTAPIVRDVTYRVRVWVDLPAPQWGQPNSGKYTFAIKPSGETIPEAVSRGHLYVLDPWWSQSWLYARSLTFNNTVAENLVDFTVLVSLNATNFDFSHANADGSDLRFLDSDNTTELAYEIERYETANSTATIWVKVPQIDASSNTDMIWLYYGNTGASDSQNITGTWDSNYVLVQHLNENPDGTPPECLDSTSYDNDGTPSAGINIEDRVDGFAGYALHWDGAADYFTIPHSNSLNVTSYTIQAIAMYDSLAGNIMDKSYGGGALPLRFGDMSAATEKFGFYNGAWRVINYNTFSTGAWHVITFRTSAATDWAYLYKGTAEVANADMVNDPTFNSCQLNLGTYYNAGAETHDDFLDGKIDELRISNVDRGANWVTIQSMSLTNTLITYGSELFGTLATPPTDFSVEQSGAGTANATWTTPTGVALTIVRASTRGYPTSPTDGYLVYNGTASMAIDNGLDLTWSNYYYSCWTWNTNGYSTTYVTDNVRGGEGMTMLLFGIIPLALMVVAYWRRSMSLSIGAAVAWVGMGLYIRTFSTATYDVYWLFFMLGMVLALISMFEMLAIRTSRQVQPVAKLSASDTYMDDILEERAKVSKVRRAIRGRRGLRR